MKKDNSTLTFLIIAIVIEALFTTIAVKSCKSPNIPQEFEYKHHDYIYFPGKGIIHSPECKQCTLTFETI